MISGMTVILSASSHSPPTVEAIAISGSRIVPAWLDRTPSNSPTEQRAQHQPGGALARRQPFIAASGT